MPGSGRDATWAGDQGRRLVARGEVVDQSRPPQRLLERLDPVCAGQPLSIMGHQLRSRGPLVLGVQPASMPVASSGLNADARPALTAAPEKHLHASGAA